MKKIINKPDDVVVEMLKGLALSRPDLIGLIPEKRVVYRKDPYLNKVAIISGSGSGHEPDQAFYVGKGMLEFEGGPAVETVIINDDVAVKDSTFTAGRRGVAGAIFVYKIIGAKSEEEGVNLQQLKKYAIEVNDNIRTMGFALKSCTTPAKGSPTFDLGEDEIELGVGLHGEPGRERTKYKPADEVIKIITDSVIEDLPFF